MLSVIPSCLKVHIASILSPFFLPDNSPLRPSFKLGSQFISPVTVPPFITSWIVVVSWFRVPSVRKKQSAVIAEGLLTGATWPGSVWVPSVAAVSVSTVLVVGDEQDTMVRAIIKSARCFIMRKRRKVVKVWIIAWALTFVNCEPTEEAWQCRGIYTVMMMSTMITPLLNSRH